MFVQKEFKSRKIISKKNFYPFIELMLTKKKARAFLIALYIARNFTTDSQISVGHQKCVSLAL